MALITSFWLYDVLTVSCVLASALYAFFKYRFQHWKKRGIPYLEPSFPSGNFQGINRTKSFMVLTEEIYKKGADHKIFGCFLFNQPILIVRDLELVKNVLIKDFGHFQDRGAEVDVSKEPLAGHLLLLRGQEWRNLRAKLTPTFTSGKIKKMFLTVVDVGKQLRQVLDEETIKDDTEVKDILARYSTDIISSVVFGLESNSLKNPNNDFRKYGQEIITPSLRTNILNLLFVFFPALAKYLPITLVPKHITDFFVGTIKETMDYRVNNNVERNDFLQLLLQLKTLGYVKDVDHPQEVTGNEQKFTYEQAAAQAFLFFIAGFETSASTMQFALYELAINQDLQTLVQKEIDTIKAKYGGEFTYEGLVEMELLDRIVNETLRKHPVGGLLTRHCQKTYSIPDSSITLRPGDLLFFPLFGYHHDPEYFPNPDKFDPDRFLPEAKASRPSCAYMPFGEGPRNCIGIRFGLLTVKTGLALILSEFSFSPSKKTPIPMILDPKSPGVSPLGAMHLKISKRS